MSDTENVNYLNVNPWNFKKNNSEQTQRAFSNFFSFFLGGQHGSLHLGYMMSVLTPEICTFILEFQGAVFWVGLFAGQIKVFCMNSDGSVRREDIQWHVASQGTVRGAGMGCRFHFPT